jgi:hypothetical protein
MQDPIIQWVAQRFFDRTLQPRELLTVRKGVYIGLIVLLFTVSFLWRRYSVAAQADNLALREQNRGDVELSGSVVRLTLTGSRGLATCVLWVQAIDKQKKNQWNELEFLVRSLTKLQPHFITPWLFQSWNLSYNVAVESDRISDKYFYVTRGIQLLAEGERQNRHNPQMRFSIGFYTQHKICQSDESNVMRSLFQLSCMPPGKRDPARFRRVNEKGEEEFDWQEFEEFCKENPQLVRRLREGTRREAVASERQQIMAQQAQFTCESAEEVVAFLAANYRVPSVYEESPPTPAGTRWDKNKQDKLRKDPVDRFPVLPPGKDRPTTPPQRRYEPLPNFPELDADKTLNDGTDAYDASRAWFGYAQEPLPDPGEFPGQPKEVTNRVVQRQAKMMTILFRQYPALTQSLKAQRLQQEGWFDTEPWPIDKYAKGEGWFRSRGNRFSDGSPARLKLDRERTAQATWDYAAQMWEQHGQRNKLLFLSPADEVNTRELAEEFFRKDFPAGKVGDIPPEPSGGPDTLPEEKRRRWKAARYLFDYQLTRRESNFAHHYMRARVERTDTATTARRLFFDAEGARLQSSYQAALDLYRDPRAMPAWRDQILLANPEFRNDMFIQEESFGVQLSYMLILNRQYVRAARRDIVRGSALLTTLVPVPGRWWQRTAWVPLAPLPGAPLQPALQPLVTLALMTPTREQGVNIDPQTTEGTEWDLVGGPFDVRLVDEEAGWRVPASLVGTLAPPGTIEPWSSLGAVGALPTKPLIRPDIRLQVLQARGLRQERPSQQPQGQPTRITPPPPGVVP